MMGAAYQAKHGLLHNNCSFDEIIRCLPEPTPVCKPYDDAESVSKISLKKFSYCYNVDDVLYSILLDL